MRTNLLEALVCLCIGLVLAATGFLLTSLATNVPTVSDLNEFNWDAVGAAMSFLGAVATVLAVIAALRIAGGEERRAHRARTENQEASATLISRELYLQRARIADIRNAFFDRAEDFTHQTATAIANHAIKIRTTFVETAIANIGAFDSPGPHHLAMVTIHANELMETARNWLSIENGRFAAPILREFRRDMQRAAACAQYTYIHASLYFDEVGKQTPEALDPRECLTRDEYELMHGPSPPPAAN